MSTNKFERYIPKTEELYIQGEAILKGFGFKKKEIISEYKIDISGGTWFIVDIAGISDKLKVAVEIGSCKPEKLFQLKLLFDHVVWLPYWLIKIQKGEEELKTLLAGKTTRIENLRNQLQEARQDRRRVEGYLNHLGHVSRNQVVEGCIYCEAENP